MQKCGDILIIENKQYKQIIFLARINYFILAFFIGIVGMTFNPNYALDFVMKTQNAIKISTHGLFLKKEYFCILNLKIGVSAYF